MRRLGAFIFIIIITLSTTVHANMLPNTNLFYSGEIRLIHEIQDENIETNPYYSLHLMGAITPALYITSFLRSGGEIIDTLYLNYKLDNLKIIAGDNILNELGGTFFSFDYNQRGALFDYQLLDNSASIKIYGANVKGINTKEEIEGNNNTGPYYLNYFPIIPESEIIQINNIPLEEKEYILDYQTGELFFNKPLSNKEKVVITYSYQPGGGFYERSIKGLSSSFNLSQLSTKLNLMNIADIPNVNSKNLFIYPPRTLKAGFLTTEWKPLEWFKIENELAFSELDTDYRSKQGRALKTSLKLEKELNYIQHEYFYQEQDFISFMEQSEPDPKKVNTTEIRWYPIPGLYLFSQLKFSHDNPENNPNLITTFEKSKLLKIHWDYNLHHSYQLIFKKEDTGDDLIYLPVGQTITTSSFNYNYSKNLELNTGIEVGELLKKNQNISNLNHNFYNFNTRLNWNNDKFGIKSIIESKYIKPKNKSTPNLDTFLKYNLSHNLPKGELLYSSEQEIETNYRQHLQTFSLRHFLINKLQTKTSYQIEREESPDGSNKKKKINIGLIYFAPLQININGEFDLKQNINKAFLILNKNDNKLKIYWLKNKERKEISLNTNINLTPETRVKPSLKYYQDHKTENEVLLFNLKATHQLNQQTKIKLSGQTPIREKIPENETLYKLELIYSL